MLIDKLPDTLDSLLLEAGPIRTPGLHLSDIIYSILATTDPKKYGGPINTLYTDPGFTFEKVLENAWLSRLAKIARPGEVVHDGIACSPDGIDYTDIREPELIEMKMTEMSNVDCPTDPKFRKWLWQMAAYCHVCGLTTARLHVLWLRGNYKEVRRDYGVWRITWAVEELDAIWQMLVDHARQKGWLVQTPQGLVWSGGLLKRRDAA